jgi:hypothetical protein
MKRTRICLPVILILSLSACTGLTPTPEIDIVPLAPVVTATLQEQVVALATQTTAMPDPTSPAVTEAATQPPAQMPPLNSDGWQRISAKLPFTFELPDGWITPDGFIPGAPYWVPAGVILVNGQPVLAVNEFEMTGEKDPQVWPQNSAVEHRTTLDANGQSYAMVEVTVFNGEGGTVSSYEAHVVIPVTSANKVYGLYVIAPTKADRAALEDILAHAVQTLEFAQ